MLKKHVGILVNDRLFRGIPLGKTGYEAIRLYENAGERYDLVPCYFRLRDIRDGRSHVQAYIRTGGRYIRRMVPLPRVIHNRGIWFSPHARRKIDRLAARGVAVFNQWNRYGKLSVHELLMREPLLRPHLPHTEKATNDNLRMMLGLYSSLIVKPNSGSVGQGVMLLERTADGWLLDHAVRLKSRQRVQTPFRPDAFPRPLAKALSAGTHLVQQRLPLATYLGRPFDLRVSVQKNVAGSWQVTGINVKIARPRAFLTNVAQGSTVCDLPTVLTQYPQLQPEIVRSEIEAFALQTARHLDRHLPHLADLGLDIGLTQHGYPLFIECNGRDQRITYKKAGLMKEFQAVYETPIGYARYLYDREGG